jgi:hypothetical protein
MATLEVGPGGGQLADAAGMFAQGSAEFFEDGIEFDRIGGSYGVGAKLANVVFQAARPGVVAEATAKERTKKRLGIHHTEL